MDTAARTGGSGAEARRPRGGVEGSIRVGPWDWVRTAQGVGLWRVGALEAEGVGAVFSSRLGGASLPPWDTLNLGAAVGDAEDAVAGNRARFAAAAGFPPEAVATASQVHGADVLPVSRPGPAGPGDALCTDAPGVVLTIGVADCAAVYLHDPRHHAVALCHAGWRGTVADVAGRAVAEMVRRYGSRPGDVRAAVSPCAGACCYQVDAPVIDALEAAVPWAGEVLHPDGPGRARLDLADANRRRLLAAGLDGGAVSVAGICTICDPERLFSHRRDAGRTGRMRAALWLRPGARR